MRHAADIEDRRELVTSGLLAHLSIRAIAAELNIPRSTVARDIKAIRAEWQQRRIDAIENAVAEELVRLDAMERAIWGFAGDRQTAADPDVVFAALDRLMKIRERRAKMLGLDAPKRIDITGMVSDLAREAGLSEEDTAAAVREAERLTKVHE